MHTLPAAAATAASALSAASMSAAVTSGSASSRSLSPGRAKSRMMRARMLICVGPDLKWKGWAVLWSKHELDIVVLVRHMARPAAIASMISSTDAPPLLPLLAPPPRPLPHRPCRSVGCWRRKVITGPGQSQMGEDNTIALTIPSHLPAL